MRLNVKGLLVHLEDNKTDVVRRSHDQPIDTKAMAQRKQQLRIKRWLLHHKKSRDHRILCIVFGSLGLIVLPVLMFLGHLAAAQQVHPLALFIIIPIALCGVVTVAMLIRDLRRVDQEARRIIQRHGNSKHAKVM